METQPVLVFCLQWVQNNLPSLIPLMIELLKAAVPVLALVVAGYAVHALAVRPKGGRR